MWLVEYRNEGQAVEVLLLCRQGLEFSNIELRVIRGLCLEELRSSHW